MKTRYRAFDKLMMLPLVLYVVATSGMAERMVVEEMGARKPQSDKTHVMTTLRRSLKRSYWAASISQ